MTDKPQRPRRVLLVGGLGYKNVGDEGQAGASLWRWTSSVTDVRVTVLSPDPGYTQRLHDAHVELAPRIIWFKADKSRHYFRSDVVFKAWFASQYLRQTTSAWCRRLGLPYVLSTRAEARLLDAIAAADVVHFSGGGYLTGATQSRLWENCLVMRLCQLLGTPYVLTGHNIGVFRGPVDRWLARRGLGRAKYIGLRDQGVSANELRAIGIVGPHVKTTIDDALFCDRATDEELRACLVEQGVDPIRGYVALHFHEWGQSPAMAQKAAARFVALAEHLARKHGLQLLLIPMVPSDEGAQDQIIAKASVPIVRLNHQYRYQLAAAAFANARMTLTFKHHPIIFSFGNAVPVVAVALDDYYHHKNAGAMALCGQEAQCLNDDDYFGTRAFESLDAVLAQRSILSERIQEWLNTVAGLDTEVQQLMQSEWTGVNAHFSRDMTTTA